MANYVDFSVELIEEMFRTGSRTAFVVEQGLPTEAVLERAELRPMRLLRLYFDHEVPEQITIKTLARGLLNELRYERDVMRREYDAAELHWRSMRHPGQDKEEELDARAVKDEKLAIYGVLVRVVNRFEKELGVNGR